MEYNSEGMNEYDLCGGRHSWRPLLFCTFLASFQDTLHRHKPVALVTKHFLGVWIVGLVKRYFYPFVIWYMQRNLLQFSYFNAYFFYRLRTREQCNISKRIELHQMWGR